MENSDNQQNQSAVVSGVKMPSKMSVLLNLLAIIALLLFINFLHNESPEEKIAREKTEELKKNQDRLKKILKGKLYFKDPDTGKCFMYIWDGGGGGGPALAPVPCESVPEGKLTTM